jgi:hypothetical protein
MDCKDCKDRKEVNPYFGADAAMDRLSQIIKWLIWALIVCVVLLALTNGYWVYQWTQYDYSGSTSEEVTVDGKDGIANYVGGYINGGMINNGVCEGEEDTDPHPNP